MYKSPGLMGVYFTSRILTLPRKNIHCELAQMVYSPDFDAHEQKE